MPPSGDAQPSCPSYRAQVKENKQTGPAAYRGVAGPSARQATQTQEVIVMTASHPARRYAAALWRTARHAAAALRAIHDEQMLMWELLCQSSRVPVDRAGPLAWTPGLDGHRLTGSHLPAAGDASAGRRP